MVVNLEEIYEKLTEKLPTPIKTRCTECHIEMITYLDASYIHKKDDRIKILRPSNCPECAKLDGLLVTIVGEIAMNGKLYPKNETGRLG